MSSPSYFGEEYDLFRKFEKATTEEERTAIINEFEELPIKMTPFYARWIGIHDAYAYECWTESGYDPSLSTIRRDIQLLGAMQYGKADIDNGGFHQFFSNSTGIFAPEMVEWCDRAGLPETAAIIRQAIAFFGDEFPRSREVRNGILEGYAKKSETDDRDTIPIGRQVWDPFDSLSDQFYASLPYDKKTFDNAADRWLRDVCGIHSLHDTIPAKKHEP